uniref:Protein kinase domain-containing protein n=1 Tax=Heterorhabditis bacteriophora TaxID=37862 RepID=A0A1I7XTE0_HETBA
MQHTYMNCFGMSFDSVSEESNSNELPPKNVSNGHHHSKDTDAMEISPSSSHERRSRRDSRDKERSGSPRYKSHSKKKRWERTPSCSPPFSRRRRSGGKTRRRKSSSSSSSDDPITALREQTTLCGELMRQHGDLADALRRNRDKKKKSKARKRDSSTSTSSSDGVRGGKSGEMASVSLISLPPACPPPQYMDANAQYMYLQQMQQMAPGLVVPPAVPPPPMPAIHLPPPPIPPVPGVNELSAPVPNPMLVNTGIPPPLPLQPAPPLIPNQPPPFPPSSMVPQPSSSRLPMPNISNITTKKRNYDRPVVLNKTKRDIDISNEWGSGFVEKYDILDQVGEGTYGQVYKAKDRITGLTYFCVLKVRYSTKVLQFNCYNTFWICRLMPTGAIDLLDKLLALDPKRRMSAKDALNHFWIKTLDSSSVPPLKLPQNQDCHELWSKKQRKERRSVHGRPAPPAAAPPPTVIAPVASNSSRQFERGNSNNGEGNGMNPGKEEALKQAMECAMRDPPDTAQLRAVMLYLSEEEAKDVYSSLKQAGVLGNANLSGDRSARDQIIQMLQDPMPNSM